jgi:predicted nucleic acid-binding Zn ribbon protein
VNDDPVPLRDALGRVSRALGMPDPDVVRAIEDAWDDVAGPELAGHTRPGSVRDGTLTVLVESPAWGGQLRYAEATIVERIERLVGSGAVHSVRAAIVG